MRRIATMTATVLATRLAALPRHCHTTATPNDPPRDDTFRPSLTPGKVQVRVHDPTNTPPGEPSHHVYSFDEGKTLMECLRDDTSAIGIVGACNGTCKCSTCHVFIDPAWVDRAAQTSPPDDFELDLLSEVADARANSRLSCQVTLDEAMNGLEVEIPSTLEDVRFSRMR